MGATPSASLTSNKVQRRPAALPVSSDGKEKRLSLGVYPDVGLSEARERHADARKLIAKKIGPSAQRKAEKRDAKGRAENSFVAVARKWYSKQSHVWVESHASDVLRRLESNPFQDLGAQPIAAITAPDLLASIRKIEARGAHDLAHRVLQVAGQVFRYGIACSPVHTNVNASRRRARRLDNPGGSDAMEREHVVPLSRQAVELLRQVNAISAIAATFLPERPERPRDQAADDCTRSSPAKSGVSCAYL